MKTVFPKINEIYGFVGYGVLLAQVLEGTLEQAILVLVLLRNKRCEVEEISAKQSLAEWKNFIEQNDLSEKEKMLGTLLTTLRKADVVPNEVLVDIDNARINRNYLAHQFFKDMLPSFYTEAGQDKALELLRNACFNIKRADDRLKSIIQGDMERYSYDQQYLEDFAKSEIANAASKL